jgi:hypothetical protein
MIFRTYWAWGVTALLFIVFPVHADQNPAQEVADKCGVELQTFCKDVTPGEGRILACLYAYSDQSSDHCKDVVREAFEHLKLMSAVSSHIKTECGDDLERFCKDVEPGEGRLLGCLEKYDRKLSQKCSSALKDVGLKE